MLYLYIIFFVLLSCIPSIANTYDAGPIFDENSWGQPFLSGNSNTSSCCNYDSSTYIQNWGIGHTGIDLGMNKVSIGDSVKAISNGIIVGRRLQCTGSLRKANASLVLVKHKTSSGVEFIAIYGHTAPLDLSCSGLARGQKYKEDRTEIAVQQGQEIGTLVKYGVPHMHFGIAVGASVDTLFSGWGRYSSKAGSPPDYFRNPEDFLLANSPSQASGECTGEYVNGFWHVYCP